MASLIQLHEESGPSRPLAPFPLSFCDREEPEVIAALDVEGKRARLEHKRGHLKVQLQEIHLQALNVKALLLAIEADILDLDLIMAEENPNTSKEELARLHADYDAHYVRALEELQIRGRTPTFNRVRDMTSVSMSSPTRPPASSPLGHLTRASPMSDIRMVL